MLTRLAKWWVQDERDWPRERRSRHPIPDDQASLHYLNCLVARLWDKYWWDHLPWHHRWAYRYLGFHDPLPRMYLEPGEEFK